MDIVLWISAAIKCRDEHELGGKASEEILFARNLETWHVVKKGPEHSDKSVVKRILLAKLLAHLAK